MEQQDLIPKAEATEAKTQQSTMVDVHSLVNELLALKQEIASLKQQQPEPAKSYNAYENAKIATEAEIKAKQNEEFLTKIAEENFNLHHTLATMGGVYAKLSERVKNDGFQGLDANKNLKLGLVKEIFSDPRYRSCVPAVYNKEIQNFNNSSEVEKIENINYFYDKIVGVTLENFEKKQQELVRQQGANKVLDDSYTSKFLGIRQRFAYWQQ